MNKGKTARDIIRAIAGGCGDNSCLISKPLGMGTNGGCRCHKRIVDALFTQEEELPAALAEAEDRARRARDLIVRASSRAAPMLHEGYVLAEIDGDTWMAMREIAAAEREAEGKGD